MWMSLPIAPEALPEVFLRGLCVLSGFFLTVGRTRNDFAEQRLIDASASYVRAEAPGVIFAGQRVAGSSRGRDAERPDVPIRHGKSHRPTSCWSRRTRAGSPGDAPARISESRSSGHCPIGADVDDVIGLRRDVRRQRGRTGDTGDDEPHAAQHALHEQRREQLGSTRYRPASFNESGGSACSIDARRASSHGGRTSVSPRCAGSSSTANPGPSVASSNKTPPGSLK
jgi:hypothetical protein